MAAAPRHRDPLARPINHITKALLCFELRNAAGNGELVLSAGVQCGANALGHAPRLVIG